MWINTIHGKRIVVQTVHLLDGVRPEINSNVHAMYAKLMMECWNQAPSNGPSFTEIEGRLTYTEDDTINHSAFSPSATSPRKIAVNTTAACRLANRTLFPCSQQPSILDQAKEAQFDSQQSEMGTGKEEQPGSQELRDLELAEVQPSRQQLFESDVGNKVQPSTQQSIADESINTEQELHPSSQQPSEVDPANEAQFDTQQSQMGTEKEEQPASLNVSQLEPPKKVQPSRKQLFGSGLGNVVQHISQQFSVDKETDLQPCSQEIGSEKALMLSNSHSKGDSLTLETICNRESKPFKTITLEEPTEDMLMSWSGYALKYFKISHLHNYQTTALASWRAKMDCLIVHSTSSGKSLCFELPATTGKEEDIVVVVVPIIALAKDQVQYLRDHGVKAQMLGSAARRLHLQKFSTNMMKNQKYCMSRQKL